jgi:hypothetical protein
MFIYDKILNAFLWYYNHRYTTILHTEHSQLIIMYESLWINLNRVAMKLPE